MENYNTGRSARDPPVGQEYLASNEGTLLPKSANEQGGTAELSKWKPFLSKDEINPDEKTNLNDTEDWQNTINVELPNSLATDEQVQDTVRDTVREREVEPGFRLEEVTDELDTYRN